jgi:hypothetical protein
MLGESTERLDTDSEESTPSGFVALLATTAR